ncbi:YdcF family protein [Shewanella sp. AS1]|uniref:YdcF family protein n=1 Tax=Shewanella sp. AS1 TaxID=2907626 RepID=UPI001F37AB68|nr:YdcF family protein [Shewanella sp. AS1]MCE9680082.1 YdcF family protein [Shewanella sp. AS1]
MPIPLTLLFLLIALLLIRGLSWSVSRWAKSFIGAAVLLLLVLTSQWGSFALTRSLEENYLVNNRPISSPCVVMVLGSAHDSKVSELATLQLSSTALARLTEGIRQLSLGQDCKLVVSGWGGADVRPQAEVMAEAAIALGVDKQDIVKFPNAKDTIEEAQYLKVLIGDKPFRLVTSATHMPRAMKIFTHLQMTPQAAPSDFIARGGYWWQLDALNLLASQKSIHEYVGLLWLTIKFSLLQGTDYRIDGAKSNRNAAESVSH